MLLSSARGPGRELLPEEGPGSRMPRPERVGEKHNRQNANWTARSHERRDPIWWPEHSRRFDGVSQALRLRSRRTTSVFLLDRRRVSRSCRNATRNEQARAWQENPRVPRFLLSLSALPFRDWVLLQRHAAKNSLDQRAIG